MRIKEFRLSDNGDFDILISFSREDIKKLGIDTQFQMNRTKDILPFILESLKKEILADDRRTWG